LPTGETENSQVEPPPKVTIAYKIPSAPSKNRTSSKAGEKPQEEVVDQPNINHLEQPVEA
jgi:hypothetical protein